MFPKEPSIDILLVWVGGSLLITVATFAVATILTVLWLTSEKRNRG